MANKIQEHNITEQLVAAANEVFTQMLGAELKIIDPKGPLAPTYHVDGVLAVIGLTGELVGSGFLSCSDATACDLSSRFMMSTIETVDDEVLDAVGEITNMVVGGFKNGLEDQLGPVKMSTPTVVHGTNLSARNPNANVTVPVWCSYEDREVLLMVSIATDAQERIMSGHHLAESV